MVETKVRNLQMEKQLKLHSVSHTSIRATKGKPQIPRSRLYLKDYQHFPDPWGSSVVSYGVRLLTRTKKSPPVTCDPLTGSVKLGAKSCEELA